MRGRDLLAVADELARGRTEPHWRTALGRAYYALFLEAREALRRWGFGPPPRDRAHHFVRDHFAVPAEPTLKQIGRVLEDNGRLRNQADYDLAFASPGLQTAARKAIANARAAIAFLDQLDADPARRAAAVAAIRAAVLSPPP